MTLDLLQRYKNAGDILQGTMTNTLVMNDGVFPHWINNSQSFWYIRTTKNGKEFRLVNADARSNSSLFDQEVLAELLTDSVGQSVKACNLPISDIQVVLTPLEIRFEAFDKKWLFEVDKSKCRQIDEPPVSSQHLFSPDGKKSVFVEDYNLWVLNELSGEKYALTQDGFEDFSYGCAHYPELDGSLQAQWSPDSKKILTIQRDTRNVESRPFVSYSKRDNCVKPKLTQVKRAYPGDKEVESCRLVVIDVETGELQAAEYPPLMASGYYFGFLKGKPLAWWSADGGQVFFVDLERGAKAVRVVRLDVATGETKNLFQEKSDTFVRLSHGIDIPMFLPLIESSELIWFSERSGWGHLYLYDLNTGNLKRQLTKGEWLVRDLLHYDAKRREIVVQTAGRDHSISPYYRDVCRINIDTTAMTPILTGCFEHIVYQSYSTAVWALNVFGLDDTTVNGISPDAKYLVVTRSRVDTVPESVLVDRNGTELLIVEVADASGLPEDWVWPEPVKLKGADSQTDIYGVVFRPLDFTPEKSYPVIDFSTGVRNIPCLPQGSFINDSCHSLYYLLGAALASLGFIVVAMEGRGTTLRSKAFLDHNYGDVASTSDFKDRIAGLHQLADRYPYMDLERVGVTGLDAIANSIYGMLDYPDFYKVGVLHCYHDPRFSRPAHAESYDGISIDGDSKTNRKYAEDYVGALKGKLLLIQGMMDIYTPGSTFCLVDALHKANKDFDMLCLPSVGTDIPAYAIRKSWDYLVRHLQGVEPPPEVNLSTGFDLLLS